MKTSKTKNWFSITERWFDRKPVLTSLLLMSRVHFKLLGIQCSLLLIIIIIFSF